MKGAMRKHNALRRAFPFVLVYALGALLLVTASQVSGPLSNWLVVAGAVWLLGVANLIAVSATHGRAAPHPEYVSSWLAFAEEVLARSCETVVLSALLPVGWTLRLLGLRRGVLHRWWLRRWRALARFDARWYSRALARHRAAAAQYGGLTPSSVRALERVHHNLARAFLFQEQIAEAAAHARMALYYAQTFHVAAEQGLDRATMHAMLARIYLGTSLRAEAEGRARVREAGLDALSNAVEARWISPELHGKAWGIGTLVSELERLSQEPELQQDTRVATLVEMLKTGTTHAGLAEARAAIHPQPEEHWLSQAEREEREWAAQLAGVAPQ